MLLQSRATDEVATLVERDRPGQSGLPRRDRLIHVLAIQIHAGFQAQGVARAEPGGLHACRAQAIPQADGGAFLDHDFESILAGVSGSGDEQAIGRERDKLAQLERLCRRRLAEHRCCLRPRIRPLHRDHRKVGALADQHVEGLCLGGDPGQVLVARRCIDHGAEEILGEEIDDQVIDHAAFGIQHARVQRLAGYLELVDVVGQQMAQELARARPVHVDNGHVRNVEHAGVAAHGMMLLDLRTVVERHVPAAEIDHLGAKRTVRIVEYSLARHGIGLQGKSRL